jgi:hypothetical protein
MSAGAPHVPRDVGLQVERTALAWRRTTAAIVANGLLILRSGLSTERHAITALAIIVLFAAGAMFAFGAWRGKHLLKAHGVVVAPTLAPFAMTVVVLFVCATGTASVVH